MSIEGFLNELEKQELAVKTKEQQEEERKQAEILDKAQYIERFTSYYEAEIVPKIENFKEKLSVSGKFSLTYDSTMNRQQHGVYEANITIVPNFINFVKNLEINIIVEDGRKLVTISGQSENAKGQRIGDGILTSQDSFENFIKLDLEAEFLKILSKTFLRSTSE